MSTTTPPLISDETLVELYDEVASEFGRPPGAAWAAASRRRQQSCAVLMRDLVRLWHFTGQPFDALNAQDVAVAAYDAAERLGLKHTPWDESSDDVRRQHERFAEALIEAAHVEAEVTA